MISTVQDSSARIQSCFFVAVFLKLFCQYIYCNTASSTVHVILRVLLSKTIQYTAIRKRWVNDSHPFRSMSSFGSKRHILGKFGSHH